VPDYNTEVLNGCPSKVLGQAGLVRVGGPPLTPASRQTQVFPLTFNV